MRLVATLAIGDAAQLESIEAVDDPRAPISRPLPSVDQAELEGSLLLLAEDHPVNRKVLVSQLNAVGFAVETADDGVYALDAFRSGRYALVFSDLNMPRMDGYELAGEIRAIEAAEGRERTPVIALTANVMQGEPERCAAAGMDDFVGKPTTIPFLAAKLRRWLPHVAWPQAPAIVAPAPVHAAPAGSDVLDPAALNELTGGDQTLAGEVLQDFCEESRSDLSGLCVAVERRDADEVRSQAHRINGASRMVGAREVREIASRIEAEARADAPDWELVDGQLDQLPEALERVAAAADERRQRAL
jgi:CheY-like chemotaxis protein/HPt (histidine-containing phosphotransfer) domain-containing protein